MSVDYNGVGGVGIKITEEMIECMVESNQFTASEWEEDVCGCLEELGVIYAEGGAAGYGGEQRLYLFVAGETLNAVVLNAPLFIEKLASLGIIITLEEIIVISDYCMW